MLFNTLHSEPLTTASRTSTAYLYAAAYAVFFMLAVIPIWRVSHPPLLDYPNHLARMYIISHASQVPINQYYEIRWAIVPNLAMDLVVPFLNQLFPLTVAAKLFITSAFFLLTAGSLILSKAIFGKMSPIAFASFLLLYNRAFEMGFLNFLFSCGLALFAIAIWIGMAHEKAWLRRLCGIVVAPILFFSHLYGFVIYAFFTLAYEVWNGARHARTASSRFSTHDLLCIWFPQFLFPAVLFAFFSPTASVVGGLPQDLKMIHRMVLGQEWITSKLGALSNVLPGYEPRVDLVVALGLGGLLLYAAIAASKSFPTYAWVAICLALALYLFLPAAMFGGTYIDWRLLIPLAFVIVSALPYRSQSTLTLWCVLCLIGLLLLLIVNAVNRKWIEGERLYSEYKSIVEAIPTGARLFPYSLCSTNQDLTFPIPVEHLVSFAVIDRQAFVPSLFAFNGQQVLRLRTDQYSSIFAVGVDWDYIAAHYDFALNVDRGFGDVAECGPPPGWVTLRTAGRLALLQPQSRLRGALPSSPYNRE